MGVREPGEVFHSLRATFIEHMEGVGYHNNEKRT